MRVVLVVIVIPGKVKSTPSPRPKTGVRQNFIVGGLVSLLHQQIRVGCWV